MRARLPIPFYKDKLPLEKRLISSWLSFKGSPGNENCWSGTNGQIKSKIKNEAEERVIVRLSADSNQDRAIKIDNGEPKAHIYILVT